MSGITATKLDVTPICFAYGKVEVNHEEGISQADQESIAQLKDLANLLGMQQILEDVVSQLDVLESFSTKTQIKLSKTLGEAEGKTAFEKYLNGFAAACKDLQCSALPKSDRQRALARIDILREANDKIKKLELSEEVIVRIAELEAEESGVGVNKTLAAVSGLIMGMTLQLNLEDDELNAEALNKKISALCQAGVKEEVAPPIIAPPVTPPPVTQPETSKKLTVSYAASLIPAYGVYTADDSSSFEHAGSMHGNVGIGLDLLKVPAHFQLDYSGLFDMNSDWASRKARDLISLSLKYKIVNMQAHMLMERSEEAGEIYNGGFGVGIYLLNGLIYPFASGSFGGAMGGCAGIRSSYKWDKTKLKLSGQALFDYYYFSDERNRDMQPGGSLKLSWSPVSFWGADFEVGVAASGAYDIENKTTDLNFGLFVALTGKTMIDPLPVRVGGF